MELAALDFDDFTSWLSGERSLPFGLLVRIGPSIPSTTSRLQNRHQSLRYFVLDTFHVPFLY